MIREYKAEDLTQLLIYGKAFWLDSPYFEMGMEYDPEAVADMVLELAEKHYLRVYEVQGEIVGFIGIAITPLPFAPTYTMAKEMFFFVHPLNRGSVGQQLLLQAEADVEKWADIICFGDMATSKDMSEYYAKNGYSHSESTYTKEL